MPAPTAGSPNSDTKTLLVSSVNAPKGLLSWIRRAALPVCAAFLVGVLCVAPHVIAQYKLGPDDQGIPFLYSDDEDFYLARMREFLDGHPSAGSPFLLEYKNQLTLQAPIPEFLMYALPASLLGLPLPSYMILANFLFPALLFLLVYRLTRSVTASFSTERDAEWAGYAAAFFVTLGYEFLAASSWLGLFQGILPPLSLSTWVRPVNPISGALLLFSFLNTLWIFVQKPSWRWALLAGGIWALMIGYVFSWAIALALIVFLGVFFAVQRRWRSTLQTSLIFAMGVCAAFGYGFAAIVSQATIEGGDALARNGLLYSHTPIFNKFLWLGTVVFLITTLLSVWKNGWRSRSTVPAWWWFCGLCLAASHAAYLQQVVTGRTIWYHHFVQYTKPLALIACIVGITWLLRWRSTWLRNVFSVVILVCLVNGVMLTANVSSRMERFREWQNDGPVFAWLNQHAPKDCVVFVQEPGEWRSLFVPAFSHCNVYTTSYLLMKVPTERIHQMYFALLRMKGVTPETLPAWFDAYDRNVNGLFYDSWETMLATGPDAWYERTTTELEKEYAEYYKRPFADSLRDYQVDYLWTDHALSAEERESFGAAGPVFQGRGGWLYMM